MRKLLLIVGALALGVGPAVAQTSTPTSYPPPPAIVETNNLGTLAEGQSVTLRSCAYSEDPAVFFNASLVDESDEIDSAGCASQVLTVIEDGEPDGALGTGRLLAAIGAPIQLAQSDPTPIVEIDGQRFAARGNGRTNAVQVVGPDRANPAVERVVRHLFELGRPGADQANRGRGGALARTGATAVRWGLPGVALLGVGALLVLAARRRNASI